MKLVWSAKFTRAAKRAMRKNPGQLDDLSAAYDLRIVFEFRRQPQSRELEIHLLNVGTHDEVY